MAIVVVFEAQAVAGGRAELLGLFADTLGDTRACTGCEEVVVCTDPAQPDAVVLVERWASREDYGRYLTWREGRGDFGRLGRLVAGAPRLRTLDPTGI